MGAAVPRVVTSTSASGAQVIDGSLRFSGDSHLTRTPGSAGNEKTYTFSFWVKPCDVSSNTNYFFTAGSGGVGGVNNMALNFDLYNRLVFGGYKASNYDVENTEAYHRDTGWYHFVTAVDTTQGAAANRVKFYVNGIEQSKPTSGSPFAQNSTPFFNSNVPHTIGSSAASDFNGYMSQVYFIDGQALGPENFGYTDGLTNTWRPKKYTGNYNVGERINLSLTQNNEALDVVVNRVVDKCWVKSNGRWLGGGNPSDASSTPTFNLLTGEAAANLYWATTAYENTYEVTIGTSSETGTQPQWADSSGSWSTTTTVASGTFGGSYGHARTGAMTDGNVYAFTYTINADNIACNHGGWFITDEASIASYGGNPPDEQTSLNSVGARWYRGSYTLGYWIFVGVWNDFIGIQSGGSVESGYTILGGGGVNSFYLPFDGNTPIGNDKSKPIPLNRGETWSSSLSSNDGFNRSGGNNGAEKAFNGVLTSTDFASTTNNGADKTLTFGPSP